MFQMLENISKSYTEIKEKLNPRKKFTFSNHKKINSYNSTNSVETQSSSISSQNSLSSNEEKDQPPKSRNIDQDLFPFNLTKNINSEDYSIKDMKEKVLNINTSEVYGKNNLILENLEYCDIFLLHSFKACYIKNVSNCKIYVGSIAGGTHITNLNSCDVFLATHQLRIHTTHNCKFSVIVMSNPIIEDCSKLVFQDLNVQYADIDHIYEVIFILKCS